MSLKKGGSEKVMRENFHELKKSGKYPRKQQIAIVLAEAKKGKKRTKK